MLDKLFGRKEPERDDADPRARDLRIRERMQAQGITEEEAARIVLSEEELTVGRRDVQAGEVEVRKHVETEHVRETVPVRHDEVVVERRPVADAVTAAGATISESEEVRIPLRAEKVVAEKRIVAQEELVVRKQEVVRNEVVEADLRRERADVHGEGNVREVDPSDRGDSRHGG